MKQTSTISIVIIIDYVGMMLECWNGNIREVLHSILRWLFEQSLKLITGPLNRRYTQTAGQ